MFDAYYLVLVFLGLLALCGLCYLFYKLIYNIHRLQRDLNYINNEIRRTEGNERKHWKKQKRKLILSLFGIYRR